MSEALSYARRPISRWSRMSLLSVAFSILPIPLFFLAVLATRIVEVPDSLVLGSLGATILLLPLFGMTFGATAAIRSWTSDGMLHGGWLGLIGVIISLAWPIGFLSWALPHLPRC